MGTPTRPHEFAPLIPPYCPQNAAIAGFHSAPGVLVSGAGGYPAWQGFDVSGGAAVGAEGLGWTHMQPRSGPELLAHVNPHWRSSHEVAAPLPEMWCGS